MWLGKTSKLNESINTYLKNGNSENTTRSLNCTNAIFYDDWVVCNFRIFNLLDLFSASTVLKSMYKIFWTTGKSQAKCVRIKSEFKMNSRNWCSWPDSSWSNYKDQLLWQSYKKKSLVTGFRTSAISKSIQKPLE